MKKISTKALLRLSGSLKIAAICLIFLIASEILIRIPYIKDILSTDSLEGRSGYALYGSIGFLMFAQVTIIPIPALPILIFCNSSVLLAATPELSSLISIRSLLFVLFIAVCATLGAICSYCVGRLFGSKAIRWVGADQSDYDKWCAKINKPLGKWLYASTIVLPLFPDDLLSVVAGAVKIDFKFYCLVQLVGKVMGFYATFFFIRLPGMSFLFNSAGSGSPVTLIIYGFLLVVILVLQLIFHELLKEE